jgi:beta-galactosidase beta subunit
MPVEKVFGFSEEEVHAAYNNVQRQSQIGKTVIKLY